MDPQAAQGRPAHQGPRPGQAQLGPPVAPATAVLDQAHLGDIEGAFGHVKLGDVQQAGLKRKLITFLAIVGPGIIVMVGDNDAGGEIGRAHV